MGLFGKLFEKKECAICGGEIGLLGNRKLEDGNMCKDCAKLLSPWFSDRRRSTVEDIKAQLAYREENKARVAAFHTTRSLGERTRVLLDEDAGRFLVTSERDLEKANPDVLDFSAVTGCRLDIDEDRREVLRDGPDGKKVSYQPPRYEWSYDFDIVITVEHPWFDEMRFRINPRSVEMVSELGVAAGRGLAKSGLGKLLTVGGGFDPSYNVEYREYKQMGDEICAALTAVREGVRAEAAAAAAPKRSVTCPCCGATTTPDSSGRCEYCGGSVDG